MEIWARPFLTWAMIGRNFIAKLSKIFLNGLQKYCFSENSMPLPRNSKQKTKKFHSVMTLMGH